MKLELLDRLKEPSTYAGFSVLAVLFGVQIEQFQAIANVIASIAAALGMFMSEKKPEV